ncbi:hypothetical protein HanPI659440_Chr07g0254311 [Helianthus annuus]|nr:hypothetical protein HanPI659440_Chr07g0254311 [Helianthus annuus]
MTSFVRTHLNGGSSPEVLDVERTCFRCPSQWSPARPKDHVRSRTCIFKSPSLLSLGRDFANCSFKLLSYADDVSLLEWFK